MSKPLFLMLPTPTYDAVIVLVGAKVNTPAEVPAVEYQLPDTWRFPEGLL